MNIKHTKFVYPPKCAHWPERGAESMHLDRQHLTRQHLTRQHRSCRAPLDTADTAHKPTTPDRQRWQQPNRRP